MDHEENENFGMSEEDLAKAYKRQTILLTIKHYLSEIIPVLVKILNAFLYYTIKLIKNIVTLVFRMIMGKET